MQIGLCGFKQVFSYDFKEWMAGCYPFQSWIFLQVFFIENDLGIFMTQLAKTRFQKFSG